MRANKTAFGFGALAIGLAASLAACDGPAGEAGSSCTVVDHGDGTYTIQCDDGSDVVVSNGEAGAEGTNGNDGTSCRITDNGDGTYDIDCEDGTSVTLSDGTAGTDGTDGTSCSITDNGDGTYDIDCEDGTSVTLSDGTSGTDGTSCAVTDNGDGTHTIACEDGTSVTVADGDPGATGGNVRVTDFHGAAHLAEAAWETNGKYIATATITAATADAAGLVTVDFTVENPDGAPVTTIAAIKANIAKLEPASGGESFSKWVPYIYRLDTVTGSATHDWPNPDGTEAWQGYREDSGTLTNNHDGSYHYAYATNISAIDVGGTPVTYERGLTHRVTIMMGGRTGPTATATYDFVPDGSGSVTTRSIVTTAACQACHGSEFRGHSDRVTVESCVTCHVPGNVEPRGGESLDLKVMIHKIHAGGELATIPGADGLVWDDPATTSDESADNGTYAFWGSSGNRKEWWDAEYPAVIDNCTKCHQGSGADVDNWKNVPSRAACGSCHDDVDFASGTNHPGGAYADDTECDGCHRPSGTALSITDLHDWAEHDPRDIPEFTAALTMTAPANGLYYVAGEAPIVTLVLRDPATGLPIDHTTVAEDSTAEGCWTTVPSDLDPVPPCDASDGLFRNANLFVHGPRDNRVPVLTTAARSQVLSTGTGPFDLSAAGASLGIVVDQGQSLVRYDSSGGDYTVAGTFSVTVASAAAGTFASTAAATAAEIVTWLNANASFRARAIAFSQGGRVGIRSRNLGRVFGLQLQAGAVNTAVFGGDVAIHMPSGSTPANNVAARTDPANNDPKAVRTTGSITYALDPVDDLVSGTYVVDIEFADHGRVSPSPSTAPAVNYVAPTVARITFQVGTATEELPPARNCSTCHEGPEGTGYIVDVSRHNKVLNDTAVDQCGNCHDYMPQYVAGMSSFVAGNYQGARPISRRVHAVHYGSSLNYPLATVNYANGDPVKGRNWAITFPQDVRNCEACHPDGTTSGSWLTQPARLPCSGCHDSDYATAHMLLQTYDPTPTDPWNGDERESCPTCH
ncbi:MAG: OmcA/MtrC family decaheme c-type cytochrome [Deltaproteobacteria bacterium]|nr:OmcA/MtrC family decaheme c-type cytochrome [Deltaproteobacteria bacterium]